MLGQSLLSNKEQVADAVSTAGIMAVSVGKNALEKVIPVIAAGLLNDQLILPVLPLISFLLKI